MTIPSVSLKAARVLHLTAQGLDKRRSVRVKPQDVVDCIRRMSLLQIDAIHVVARSPYLVLFSRLGDYQPEWLDQALFDGHIFEYWAHEACFIPREDFRLVRPSMLSLENVAWRYFADWYQQHRQGIDDLLEHIRQHGAVRAADFSAKDKKQNGWWDWKPEKRHLEALFARGELMVRRRENFHRIYDLTERVMPEWSDAQHGVPAPQAKWECLKNAAGSLGIFRAGWLADYYRLKQVNMETVIQRMLDEQLVIPIQIDGSNDDHYLHHSLLPLLPDAQAGRLKATHTTLLSPFDPVVWDRQRARELFDFDYRLECYFPAEKRQYGYFVLPILQCGALTGRVDAKMHRQQHVLELKAVYLESGLRMTEKKLNDLKRAISRFAQWQHAQQVQIVKQPAVLRQYWGDGWSLDNRTQGGNT